MNEELRQFHQFTRKRKLGDLHKQDAYRAIKAKNQNRRQKFSSNPFEDLIKGRRTHRRVNMEQMFSISEDRDANQTEGVRKFAQFGRPAKRHKKKKSKVRRLPPVILGEIKK